MGRKRRREDYLRAFKQAIAYALREDVDGVIHTGNLFWTKDPPAEIVEECKKVLSRLAAADIPFWLVYGDRDQGLTVLRELRDDGLLRRLGAEWQTLDDIAVCGIDSDTDVKTVAQTDPAPTQHPRIVCSRDEISATKLTNVIGVDIQAVLLGNQNGPVDRTESGYRILSPGSPERVLGKWMTEPGTSEWSHPRRVNIYTVTEDSISVESPQLETREYEGVVLETDETTTIEDIRDRLDEVNLAGKAVLLILRGTKAEKSPSRKAIQGELSNRCEMARVYDRRDDADQGSEAARTPAGTSPQSDGAEDWETSHGQQQEDSPMAASPGLGDESPAAGSGTIAGDDIPTGSDSLPSDGADKSRPPADDRVPPLADIEFARNDIVRLDAGDGNPPDSAHLAAKFKRLQTQVEATFANTAWFDSFIWPGDPGSPYIGPPNPEESKYVWFGLSHETYRHLGKPSGGLQFEFGIDADSARGFFDCSVICGLYFGPWASDPVVSNVADRLRAHSAEIAAFLEDHSAYVLTTGDETWTSPPPDVITARAENLVDGFAITVDLTLDDLYNREAVTEYVSKSICEVLPLYSMLAETEEPEEVHTPDPDVSADSSHDRGLAAESRRDASPTGSRADPTVESIEAHSSLLDAGNIRTTVETLTEQGASRKEALQYVRQYAVDMEREEGLYAVKRLGPVAGHALAEEGITDLEDLLERSLSDLQAIDGLRDSQAETILENALDGDVPSQATESPADSSSAAGADTTPSTATKEAGDREASTLPASKSDESPSQPAGDLPVVTREGQDIPANPLSEYYEAIRCVKKVVSTVMQLRGTDINPEDLTDPRVQYYVMLDACIGFGHPDLAFAGYGQQHQDRLPFGIKDYRHAYGDGDWVTDYHAITVEPYRDETQAWLVEHTWLEDPERFVRPCAPDSDQSLPEMVGSFDHLRHALAVLNTFPAYPPLPMETGTTKRTIPVETLYRDLFADVTNEHCVDVGTLSGPDQATGEPITGPVADATPKSQTDAESFLLDYGKLTHLFQRVTPPTASAIRRLLPVFALDWYRPGSGAFNEVQDLAKHGCDEPIATFRPRLQDLVHRRFLRDRWNYDYITVFPGHKEGRLSPQLVELAQDAVIETSIIYAPLLERTETTERQREKSREERKEVALEPDATLRARAALDGETVILFDDICTSGNSLLAGAHLLRKAGAGRVIGLTLGFTPGETETAVKEIKKPDAFASDIIAGVK